MVMVVDGGGGDGGGGCGDICLAGGGKALGA